MELVLGFASDDGTEEQVILWPENDSTPKLTMTYEAWVASGRPSFYALEV